MIKKPLPSTVLQSIATIFGTHIAHAQGYRQGVMEDPFTVGEQSDYFHPFYAKNQPSIYSYYAYTAPNILPPYLVETQWPESQDQNSPKRRPITGYPTGNRWRIPKKFPDPKPGNYFIVPDYKEIPQPDPTYVPLPDEVPKPTPPQPSPHTPGLPDRDFVLNEPKFRPPTMIIRDRFPHGTSNDTCSTMRLINNQWQCPTDETIQRRISKPKIRTPAGTKVHPKYHKKVRRKQTYPKKSRYYYNIWRGLY